MMLSAALLTLSLAVCAFSQNVTVPNTCIDGYQAGSDEALVMLPYTYDQVMSIIGSYKNLTWSGNPDNTVMLNGSDNTVGTARTYDLAGAHVIETILVYDKPPSPGPYNEVHNTANLSVPAYNVSLYIPYDGTVVSSICDDKATLFNFTAHFCASNATIVASLLHMLHSNDAVTVGKFLGGQNFTTCEALGANGTAMPMPSAPPTSYTGAAAQLTWSVAGVLAGAAAALL
jgi:hypothetical protein